jgi:hypothetical protein
MRRLLVLVITFSLLPAAAAFASSGGAKVIRDCTDDGVLQGHYTQKQLRDALGSIPTDVDEYTNCRDVINQAEEQGSGGNAHSSSHGPVSGAGGSSGSGGGSGGGNTPSDVQALNNAKGSGTAPSLSLHGEKITPGTGGVFKTAGAANDVPMPVLLALIALGALTVAGALVALRRRFPEVFGATLRLFRR